MMSKILASIDLICATRTLAELARVVGMDPGRSSHDKGTPRGKRGVWDETVFRIESAAPEQTPLSFHLDDLLAMFSRLDLGGKLSSLGDVRRVLNIGLIFPTAHASLEIDVPRLAAITEAGMNLDISCYPGEGDATDVRVIAPASPQ